MTEAEVRADWDPRAPAVLADQTAAYDAITLLWASADRDEAVMGDPDDVRLDRDPADNLLYGVGIHVCPGAPLARLELRVLAEELLAATEHLGPVADAVRAQYPASGWTALKVGVR